MLARAVVIGRELPVRGPSSTTYYLSLDPLRDTADILLSGRRSVLALASGDETSGNRVVTVPSTTAAGSYRLIACADGLSKLAETDETNNCRATGTTIVVQHPQIAAA